MEVRWENLHFLIKYSWPVLFNWSLIYVVHEGWETRCLSGGASVVIHSCWSRSGPWGEAVGRGGGSGNDRRFWSDNADQAGVCAPSALSCQTAESPQRRDTINSFFPQFIGLFFTALWIPGGQSQRSIRPRSHLAHKHHPGSLHAAEP